MKSAFHMYTHHERSVLAVLTSVVSELSRAYKYKEMWKALTKCGV